MKKRLSALLLALVMALTLAVPAMAAAPLVRSTEYEGRGYVDVDFSGVVTYKNVKVTVKGADGTVYTARITDRDKDDLTFYVPGIKTGMKYTYTISGIRAGRSGSWSSVKGTFRVPAKAVWITEAEYDRIDRELEIEFNTRVQYKNLKVTVKDAFGKTYPCKVLHKGIDEIELSVKGLAAGKNYTVTVSGIRQKGVGAYMTVSETFQVVKR